MRARVGRQRAGSRAEIRSAEQVDIAPRPVWSGEQSGPAAAAAAATVAVMVAAAAASSAHSRQVNAQVGNEERYQSILRLALAAFPSI